MNELVLAIQRKQITQQVGELGYGLVNIDLSKVDQHAYAWLPRQIADAKKTDEEINCSLGMGMYFPQILGYYQIMNEAGKYLAYQRKGKEKGLFGQWSIGVGGHVGHEDLEDVIHHTGDAYPKLNTLVYAGALRELSEELSIDPREFTALHGVDEFTAHHTKMLVTLNNNTSAVHVGLPATLKLAQAGYTEDSLHLDPSEFNNYRWMGVDELKANWKDFEDWSQYLITAM